MRCCGFYVIPCSLHFHAAASQQLQNRALMIVCRHVRQRTGKPLQRLSPQRAATDPPTAHAAAGAARAHACGSGRRRSAAAAAAGGGTPPDAPHCRRQGPGGHGPGLDAGERPPGKGRSRRQRLRVARSHWAAGARLRPALLCRMRAIPSKEQSRAGLLIKPMVAAAADGSVCVWLVATGQLVTACNPQSGLPNP